MGQFLEPRLDLLFGGHVSEDRDEVGRQPLLVRDCGHRTQERLVGTGLALAPQFTLPAPVVQHAVPDRFVEIGGLAVGAQEVGVLAEGVLRGVAGDLGEGPVHRDDAAAHVGHDHAVLRAFERGRQQPAAVLAFAPLLPALELGQRIGHVGADLVEQCLLLRVVRIEALPHQHQHGGHRVVAAHRNRHGLAGCAGRHIPAQVAAAPGAHGGVLGIGSGGVERQVAWLVFRDGVVGRAAVGDQCQGRLLRIALGDPGHAEVAVADGDLADAPVQLVRGPCPDDRLVHLAQEAVEPAERLDTQFAELALADVPADGDDLISFARQGVCTGFEPAGLAVELDAVFRVRDFAGRQRAANDGVDALAGLGRHEVLVAAADQFLGRSDQLVALAEDLEIGAMGIQDKRHVRHGRGKSLQVGFPTCEFVEGLLALAGVAVELQHQAYGAECDEHQRHSAQVTLLLQVLLTDLEGQTLHRHRCLVDVEVQRLQGDRRAARVLGQALAQHLAGAGHLLHILVDGLAPAGGQRCVVVRDTDPGLQGGAAQDGILEFRVDGGDAGVVVAGAQALRLQLRRQQMQPDLVDQPDWLARFGQRVPPAQIAPDDQAHTERTEHGDHAQQSTGAPGAHVVAHRSRRRRRRLRVVHREAPMPGAMGAMP